MSSYEEFIASKGYWDELCAKCNVVGESKKGFVNLLVSTYPGLTFEGLEELFIELDITKTHRVVVFIMWLQRMSNPFGFYRQLVPKYPDTWMWALAQLALRQ